MSDRLVRARDLTLRVLDEGEGPPVLLLHGFPDRAELWRHVGARLRAAGRRTIAVDLPGFGGSDAPQGLAAYRVDAVLEELLALLDALGVEGPVDVVGHDWGAFTSWALCLLHPGRARRHVALSVGHPAAFRRGGPEQWRKSTYMVLVQVPAVPERVLRRDGFARLRAFTEHPDVEQVVADMARPGRLTAGLAWYRANLGPSTLRRWPRCAVPTLGVWPDRDAYLAEGQMVASGRLVDAAWRYERLEGAGHWLQLEAPGAVAELVLDWLDG